MEIPDLRWEKLSFQAYVEWKALSHKHQDLTEIIL